MMGLQTVCLLLENSREEYLFEEVADMYKLHLLLSGVTLPTEFPSIGGGAGEFGFGK